MSDMPSDQNHALFAGLLSNMPSKLEWFRRETGFDRSEFRYSYLLGDVPCYFPGR